MAAGTTLARLNVLIGADLSELEQKLKGAQQSLDRVGQRMTKVGAGLTKGVTLPLLAAGAAAGKAAIDFESSFAGIRKTMDLTEAEFGRLAQANRDLAKTIPVTVNELNRIGELAGQLGVRGVQNVLKFEETIAKLAVTTDLTADQAALAFAQIANVLQLPQENIDRLGAAIVDLGNNFATTESRIVDFTQRIAGAAKIAGLTAGSVTGIGAAFASLGIEAQAGGTAVQKVLIAMLQAATEGGDKLNAFAQTAGVSASEFATAFREDAAGAFADFVEGLGRQGDSAIETLTQLGLQDQRLIRAFLGAAGAGDLLRQAIERGNIAFDENTALTEEASKRFDTAASRLKVFRNRLVDVAITLGSVLVPALLDALDALEGIIDLVASAADAFAELPTSVQRTIIALAGLAAAAGPVLLVLGKLVTLGPLVAGGLAAIASPVGLVVASLATIATTAVLVQKHWEEFKGGWQVIWRAILITTAEAVDGILRAVEKLQFFMGPLVQRQTRLAREELGKHMTRAIRNVEGALQDTIIAWRDKKIAMAESEAEAKKVAQQADELQEKLKALAEDGVGGLSGGLGDLSSGLGDVGDDLEETGSRFQDMAGPLRAQIIHFRDGAAAARVFSDMLAGLTAEQALQLEQLRKTVDIWRQVAEFRDQAMELNVERVTDFRDIPEIDRLTEGLKGAGQEATFELGEELKRGGRLAMQSLLEGLLTGRDNIMQSIARIGISIASQLLSGGLFSVLGIASPAKQGIFAGRMLGLGIVKGLTATIPDVAAASFEAGQAAMGGLQFATPQQSLDVDAGQLVAPPMPLQAHSAGSADSEAGGLSAADFVEALLERVGPTPDMPPEAAVTHDWYRRLFSAGLMDAKDRGARL